jgi:hypothetical protein
MTSEERRELRILRRDLQAHIERCLDPRARAVLERQLASVEREQATDKEVSPRRRRKATT